MLGSAVSLNDSDNDNDDDNDNGKLLARNESRKSRECTGKHLSLRHFVEF